MSGIFRITRIALLFTVISFSFLFAGPNQNSLVLVDCDFKTEDIESQLPEITPGEEYFIAIIAENVKDLHSYSVKVKYNEEILKFDGAMKSISLLKLAFLESNGGTIAAFLVIPKKNDVEIAAAQAEDNASVTVNGSGVLGYLKFTGISAGNAEIEIIDAKLVDINGVLDQVVFSEDR